MIYKSTLPVSEAWEEEAVPVTDSLLWMNELQFTLQGAGLLTSNNDKCANTILTIALWEADHIY